jgi:DNA-directed RNA polymerase subunit RPC12/RpoP
MTARISLFGRQAADHAEEDALHCPGCGFHYLYHGRVTVYHREQEDDEEVLITQVDGTNPDHAPPGVFLHVC